MTEALIGKTNMRYVISDIHGEYELFVKLLDKIGFSDKDEMYICGDLIEKGRSSVKLLELVSAMPNIYCIQGNHEFDFLSHYSCLMMRAESDFDAVLERLQQRLGSDGPPLTWELIDWLDALPLYIEKEDFICVHAGIPTDNDGKLVPLDEVDPVLLVYDRRFKSEEVKHNGEKCVFFGHTPTDAVCGEDRILSYVRDGVDHPQSIKDYYKIHLDMNSWQSGILGCFNVDTLEKIYVCK